MSPSRPASKATSRKLPSAAIKEDHHTSPDAVAEALLRSGTQSPGGGTKSPTGAGSSNTVWECVTPPEDLTGGADVTSTELPFKFPEKRSQVAGCALSDKAYYFGGRQGGSSPAHTKVFDDFYVFDGSTLAWSEVQMHESSVRPGRRYAASLVASSDHSSLFLFGGSDGSNNLSDVFQFKVEDSTWYRVSTSGSDKPKGVHSHSAVVHDNYMWVYGGWVSEWGRTEKMYKLNLRTLRWDALTFQKGPTIPERRFGHVAVVQDNSMYVFGGAKSVGVTNELWKFEFESEKWHAVVPAEMQSSGNGPAPRKYAASTLLDGKWLVHGGSNSADAPNAELWVYDLNSNVWWTSELLSTLRARESHVLIQLKCPNISRLCVSFGRVKKNEDTNTSMMLSLMEGRGSANYTRDNDIILSAAVKLNEPEAGESLLSSAKAMYPVVQQTEAYTAALAQRLEKMSPDPVDMDEINGTASSGKLYQAIQNYQKVADIVLNSVDEYARLMELPADQLATDRALVESNLAAVLTEHGVTERDANIIMPSLAAGPIDSNITDTLTYRTRLALYTAVKPLDVTIERLNTIWYDILQPVFSEAATKDKDTAMVVVSQLQEEEADIQREIRDTSMRLLSTLAIKERRSFENKRMELSLGYLNFYEHEVEQIKDTLKAIPGSVDTPEFDGQVLHKHMQDLRSALQTETATAQASMAAMKTRIEALISEQKKSAERALDESECNRLKREECCKKRELILVSVEEFLTEKMKEYMEVVEVERGALLATEITHREDIELQRTVDSMRRSFEIPMEVQLQLELAIRGFLVIVDEFQRRCEMSINEVKEKSTTSAQMLAGRMTLAKHRVEVFADVMAAALTEVHERQTKTLGKLQENLNSMLNKLELLENTGEPDELQSNDDGSVFSEPLSKPQPVSKESEVFDSAIAEALTMGPQHQADGGPYHTTLHKYHQYKQLYERLRVEADSNSESLEYVATLKTRLRESIDDFWSEHNTPTDRSAVPENSYLDLLVTSKFDWKTFDSERVQMLLGLPPPKDSMFSLPVLTGSVMTPAVAPPPTAGRFAETTDDNWITSFYNIDPAKFPDAGTSAASPDQSSNRPLPRGTNRFGPTGTVSGHRLNATRVGVSRAATNVGPPSHRGAKPQPMHRGARGGSFARGGLHPPAEGGDATTTASGAPPTRRVSRLPIGGALSATRMASPSPGGAGGDSGARFGGGNRNKTLARFGSNDDMAAARGTMRGSGRGGISSLHKTFAAGPAPDAAKARGSAKPSFLSGTGNAGDVTARSRMSSNNAAAARGVRHADEATKGGRPSAVAVSTFAGATRRTAKA